MTKTIILYNDEHATISSTVKNTGASDGYSRMTFKSKRNRYNRIRNKLNPTPERVRKRKYREANHVTENLRVRNWQKVNSVKCKGYDQTFRRTSKGKIVNIRMHSRRREFGYDPMNESFNDSHFHHLHIDNNHDVGLYIPAELHKSVPHAWNDEVSMNRINALAFKWLGKTI